MKFFKVPIRPGSMITDVVENELGSYTHQEVKNLKETKEGQWESVKGYIAASEYPMNSAIEVSDDLSGDRFILFSQEGEVRRLDYNITNSPRSGYENEVYSIVTLPSGVTWDGTTKIRYFYNNGIVRITGFSDTLWYGFIYRKMFYTGLKDKESFNFETAGHVTYFTSAGYCNLAQSANPHNGTYSMSIQSIGNPMDSKGYAYRQLTLYTAGAYRLRCWVRKPTSINGTDYIIKIGTSAGAEDLFRWRQEVTNSVTWQVVDIEFEVPDDRDNATDTIYISFYPESGVGNGDTIYVDDWLLEESYPQLTLNNWYLQKSGLEKQIIEITHNYACGEQLDTIVNHYLKMAFIYDDSQYTLMNIPDIIFPNFSFGAQNIVMTSPDDGAQLMLRISGQNLITSGLLNKRFSGVLVCWATDERTQDQSQMVWSVVNRIDFNEKKRIISYRKDKLYYTPAHPKRLYLRYDSFGVDYHAQWQEGYLAVGARVIINGLFKSKVTDLSIGTGNVDYVEFEDLIYPILVTPDIVHSLDNILIQIQQVYNYDAVNGIFTNLGIDIYGGTEFFEYTSIPTGTLDNTKKYSHHQVINQIAYALSKEENEGDIIYYSPINQYDSFPDINIIQTPTGDLDSNLALLERDGRFVALKRKTVSQGQFTGSTYYHDKDGKKRGLYATEGYLVVDDILYFMDNDDIYTFNGVTVDPFLQNSRLRKIYTENVTADSFFAYNPIDKELWMVLNNYILVYDYERKRFYLRDMDIDPTLAFNSYDKGLFLHDGNKLVLINHNETTYDEPVGCYFKTGLIDAKTPEFFKTLRKIYARVLADNVNLIVTFKDYNEPRQYAHTENIDVAYTDVFMFKPVYLFKEGFLTALFSPIYTGSVKIKSFDLIIGRWR